MPLVHPFDPVVDEHSRVLILGSFPSIASFEKAFYYAHPRNQFWPIMEALFDVELPTNEARRCFALARHIALWDVYASLVRSDGNSSDANLKELTPNEMETFLNNHPSIVQLFCTGKKAYEGLKKAFPHLPVPVSLLPSTSPAYASMSFEAKKEAYAVIRQYVD